ncbi:RHS repeat domain-containing protein [Streptomyces sp. NPDC048258]|uniref:RHS repeat domain-containing protein n=1 Tax=Streptomyces sp. NPDC048258 TaxID=3365527 RepID=UPI00371873AC
MERDHRGRPIRLTDPAGSAQRFIWDAEHRLLHRVTADGSREAWRWDAEGNCLAHTDIHGGVTATGLVHGNRQQMFTTSGDTATSGRSISAEAYALPGRE